MVAFKSNNPIFDEKVMFHFHDSIMPSEEDIEVKRDV
jgi:hypothetical protein